MNLLGFVKTYISKDVIVYDSESHACILDGMRLHLGKRYVYPHNNIENLKKQLYVATGKIIYIFNKKTD